MSTPLFQSGLDAIFSIMRHGVGDTRPSDFAVVVRLVNQKHPAEKRSAAGRRPIWPRFSMSKYEDKDRTCGPSDGRNRRWLWINKREWNSWNGICQPMQSPPVIVVTLTTLIACT
jgi:hypothetical protein